MTSRASCPTSRWPISLRRRTRPDPQAYRTFRDYLLQTSQIPGGFYAGRSRAHALRQVADLMLAARDPYEALAAGTTIPRQQVDQGKS